MVKAKAYELRNKSKGDLLTTLETYRAELAQLRVVQKTGGAASKLAQIKTVRKNIARVLTVYHQKQKDSLREYAKQNKYLPTDLRHKRTRAIRRRLSSVDAARKTLRIRKREQNFPMRRFALKASE